MPEHPCQPDPTEQPWLVLPSANPQNCARTLPVWRAMGYRIAVLQDRLRFPVAADAVIETEAYHGWPWAINRLCREAVPETCSVVVAAGDDMLPDPERNGPEIAAEYLERFPDGLGVMQPTGDGYLNARWYCGSPWFGRGWIDRAFGGTGPIPTGYRHNWADMELHWASRGLGRLWQRPDLTQRHEHFARESDALPPAYWSESAAGFDRADCERFIERAWAGFPGCEPVGLEDDGSVDGGGPRYDPGEFSREYRSIAEVHLHALTGRCAWDACRRARQAMDLCLRRGWNRVAVYGNGAHTGAVWTVLADSGVRPVVILDDRADETGERFGVPVRPPEAVRARDVDAVVLSGNSVEDDLLAGAERLGRPVVRLYGEASPRVITPGGVPEDRDDAPPAPFSARAG